MDTNIDRIADTRGGSSAGSLRGRIFRPSGSLTAWLGCVAYMALVAVLLRTILSATFVDSSQALFLQPYGIVAIGALGLLGAWLSTRTGFPDALDPRVPSYKRFAIPLLIGPVLGTIFLLTAVATDMAGRQEERFGVQSTDVEFPASILVYSAGAIASEVIFRLLPLPVLLWLISNLLLRGRGRERTFWVLAVLTSTIEPLAQSVVMTVLPPYAFGFVLLQQFGANLAQAALFRKYGFLASIALRIGFYLTWHIVGAPLK